jgi:hypothetical protein
MADRFLLHKPSGVVYIYQGAYAANPDFEECADAQGTPMKPAIDGDFEVVEDKPKRVRAKKVVEAEEPAEDDLDALLSADASRGL